MRNSIPTIILQRTDSKTNTERTEEENNHSHSSRPFTYSSAKDRSQRNIPHAATMERGQKKESRVPKLGPDSRNALTPILRALYNNPFNPHKRSTDIESQMKKTSIIVYEAKKDAPFKSKIWCCITRRYYDKDKVRAVHIVPHALGPAIVDYIFGTGSGSRLDTVDNCLLMHQDVEQSFRKGNFVLIPVDARERPILRWRVQMANFAAIGTDLGKVTLRDVDGKEVLFKNNSRPAARFLYYHFVMTLIWNMSYRQPGWETYWVGLTAGRPFAAMGPYMRESILVALVYGAGELYVARDARLIATRDARLLATRDARLLAGEGETFREEQKLRDIEEGEVARRALVAHGFGAIEEDDENTSSEDDESYTEDDESSSEDDP